MSEALQINTRVRRLFHYIDDFQRGLIRVPAFQRDFIWNMKGKLDLLDSIKRGYPIGSILFWRPDFRSSQDFKQFEADKIGSYYIPPRNSDYFYILDGYQRISTLFGCLVNPSQTPLERDNAEWAREFNLVYDLREDKFEFHKRSQYPELHKVPLYKFVDSKEFFGFQKQLSSSNLPEGVINDYISKYENLSSKLVDYQIPSIDIIGASVDEAIDIFSRVNSKGAKITDDWKVSALSFNREKDFRLGSEIDNLIEDLKPYHFEKLPRKIIFQCIVNSFEKVFFDQSKPNRLEELARRSDFVEVTRNTLENIKRTVVFLHNEVCMVNSKLLPYNNQFIFITDFFNNIKQPSEKHLTKLKKWFWITSYAGYFTIYNLAKQRIAYRKFHDFIYNEELDPTYYDKPTQQFTVSDFPAKINMGSVRAKSLVLFSLNRQKEHFQGTSAVKTYYSIPIFQNTELEDSDFSDPSNVIFILHEQSENFERLRDKNLEKMIFSSSTSDLNELFINDQIKQKFNYSRDPGDILTLRKEFIRHEEGKFVEALGLSYNK